MLEIVLISSESDQYSSAPKEISRFPLMYMTGYFCRSVYKNISFNQKSRVSVVRVATVSAVFL